MRLLLMAVSICLLSTGSGRCQVREPDYQRELNQLAQTLGALHYLRNVCGETGTRWRQEMQHLLAAEQPTPDQRQKMVASFNRGYRTHQHSHLTCSSATIELIRINIERGKLIASKLINRYEG